MSFATPSHLPSSAPFADDKAARAFTCTALVDPAALKDTQRSDLALGMAAVDAFWSAVQASPIWSNPLHWPLHRCIFVALCVRDILHSEGRRDALALRFGLDVREDKPRDGRTLTIGLPSAPRLAGKWNAHLVVRLGDILLDPTHGQLKRAWNEVPHAAAFLCTAPEGSTVEIEDGVSVKVKVLHSYWREGRRFQASYFEPSLSVDLRTRNWRRSPDAARKHRLALVRAAITILRVKRKLGLAAE